MESVVGVLGRRVRDFQRIGEMVIGHIGQICVRAANSRTDFYLNLSSFHRCIYQ